MLKRGMFYSVNHDSTAIPQVGLGIQIDAKQSFCCQPPPKLGADTSRILEQWLHLSAPEITQLIEKSIIFVAPQSKGSS
jgi:crotonobetainyl-CoA:carnitine CoA-transferase CaiB-like acyl-CoA transferase